MWRELEYVTESLFILEHAASYFQVVFSVAEKVITEKYLEAFHVRWVVPGTE